MKKYYEDLEITKICSCSTGYKTSEVKIRGTKTLDKPFCNWGEDLIYEVGQNVKQIYIGDNNVKYMIRMIVNLFNL